MGNVQSIRNKTDELEACTRYMHEFREANVICLSETWLSGIDPDPVLPGFSLVRQDRSATATNKSKEGGVCVFVNDKWCTNVAVKEQHCCQNIELLSVALRPFARSGELRTQKLKSHLVRTQSLNVLPLKPGVGQYIAIHATLTARDFFLAYFYLSGPFTCIFSKTFPDVSCVGCG